MIHHKIENKFSLNSEVFLRNEGFKFDKETQSGIFVAILKWGHVDPRDSACHVGSQPLKLA